MKWQINAQDGVGHVRLYDTIWTGSAEYFIQAVEALGELQTLHVWINSNGGSVDDGFAIYSALARSPAFVHAHIEAASYSIASLIPMAANKRTIAENGLIMIHMPRVVPTEDLGSDELRLLLAATEKREQDLIDAYGSVTGLTADRLREMMERQTILDAEEALTLGFVDEIEEVIRMAAFARPDDIEVPEKYRAKFNQHFKKDTTMADNTPAGGDQNARQDPKAAQPATLAELKAAFPDAGSEYWVEMLDRQATMETASAVWTEQLSDRLKKSDEEKAALQTQIAEMQKKAEEKKPDEKPPGNDAVGGVAKAGAAGAMDARVALQDEIEKRATKIQARRPLSPMDARAQAYTEIKRSNPELLEAVLDK